MNITWHLRGDTQTCEWTFRLTEGEVHLVMALPEFFNLVKALNETCLRIGQKMVGDMNVADALAEVDRLLKAGQKGQIMKDRCLLTVNGDIIGELDRKYEITDGHVTFDEVLLKGMWPPTNNEVVFNGVLLRVDNVVSQIGLLVDEKGARGPVLKGVSCKVQA